jgi:hypothetical protein
MTKPILAISQDFQTTEDAQGSKQYFAVFNLQFEGESDLQELRIQTTPNYREMIASNVRIQAADGTPILSAEHAWQNALLQSWNAYDRRSFFKPFGKKEEVTFELQLNADGFFYDLTSESKSTLDQGFSQSLNRLTSSSSVGFYTPASNVNLTANIMSAFNRIPLPTFQDEDTQENSQAAESRPTAPQPGM